jgi:hypothetical protein
MYVLDRQAYGIVSDMYWCVSEEENLSVLLVGLRERMAKQYYERWE